MKTNQKKYSVIVIFLLCHLLLISASYSDITIDKKYVSISTFHTQKKILVAIRGLGGHQQECIEFTVTNHSSDTLPILIEKGRIIESKDISFQDILLVKDIKFDLLPLQTKKIKGYGFCCRAKRGSPPEDSKFTLGYMSEPHWIELVNEIASHNYPIDAVQHAIWALTDNHNVANIYAKNDNQIEGLRRAVSKIKKIDMPWYSLIYAPDSAQLFSYKHQKIIANVEYLLRQNAIVTIQIRDSYGRIVTTLLQNSPRGSGRYVYELDLIIKDLPKGDYELFVIEDYSRINQRKKFSL